jgi:hypothetical protein
MELLISIVKRLDDAMGKKVYMNRKKRRIFREHSGAGKAFTGVSRSQGGDGACAQNSLHVMNGVRLRAGDRQYLVTTQKGEESSIARGKTICQISSST